jgi:hypothetical protein
MADKKNHPPVSLTTGSLLILRSADKGESPLVTQGIFRGYVNLGGDQAMSIEMDGKNSEGQALTRMIPCAAILSLDILTPAKPEEEKKSVDVRPVYFG